jgi:hypothetical protein
MTSTRLSARLETLGLRALIPRRQVYDAHKERWRYDDGPPDPPPVMDLGDALVDDVVASGFRHDGRRRAHGASRNAGWLRIDPPSWEPATTGDLLVALTGILDGAASDAQELATYLRDPMWTFDEDGNQVPVDRSKVAEDAMRLIFALDAARKSIRRADTYALRLIAYLRDHPEVRPPDSVRSQPEDIAKGWLLTLAPGRVGRDDLWDRYVKAGAPGGYSARRGLFAVARQLFTEGRDRAPGDPRRFRRFFAVH